MLRMIGNGILFGLTVNVGLLAGPLMVYAGIWSASWLDLVSPLEADQEALFWDLWWLWLPLGWVWSYQVVRTSREARDELRKLLEL